MYINHKECSSKNIITHPPNPRPIQHKRKKRTKEENLVCGMTIMMVQDKNKDRCGVPSVRDNKSNILAHKLAKRNWISRGKEPK